MEVGIKIYPDKLYRTNQLAKISDFIELMVSPRVNSVKKGKIKFTVHAPHERYGVNLADKRLENRNLKLMNHTIKIANRLKSKIIVVHAGLQENKHCSLDYSLKLLKKIDDPRIIIENLSYKSELNSTPEELKIFKQELGCGICFDFSHAITVAYKKGLKSYKPFIRKFLKLKPSYFHVCDGFYDGKDRHLNLGHGKYDLKFIKKCIGKKQTALEVEYKSSLQSLKQQVEFLKK